MLHSPHCVTLDANGYFTDPRLGAEPGSVFNYICGPLPIVYSDIMYSDVQIVGAAAAAPKVSPEISLQGISDAVLPPRCLSIEMLQYYLSMYNTRGLQKLAELYSALLKAKHICEPFVESQISANRSASNGEGNLPFFAALLLSKKVCHEGRVERERCQVLLAKLITSFEHQLKLLKDKEEKEKASVELAKKTALEEISRLRDENETLHSELRSRELKLLEQNDRHESMLHLSACKIDDVNETIASQAEKLGRFEIELANAKSELLQYKPKVRIVATSSEKLSEREDALLRARRFELKEKSNERVDAAKVAYRKIANDYRSSHQEMLDAALKFSSITAHEERVRHDLYSPSASSLKPDTAVASSSASSQ